MKIINVTPGLIQIPPNGWGAVEKIIWEVHNNLLRDGHDAHICYLDQLPSDADIVHIHVANLANIAHNRGIPYYFTCHDHHAYLYGKDSEVYKENLIAMKNAVRAFVPAQYLVEYFDGIPEYFSHGVNTLYFAPLDSHKVHKLLCVANNGYVHDQAIDRKGFGTAIEAAKQLGLPITIAGPSNNKHYFEKYPPTYDKLTILYDLNEQQLLELYRSHTIFIHPSELEAGHPNLTLLEAMACGLPVVGTFEADRHFDGMVITDRTVEQTVSGIQTVISRYTEYRTAARHHAESLSWYNRTQELLIKYTTKYKTMREELLHHYGTVTKLNKTAVPKINYNNIDGMLVEILGGPDDKYEVKFIRRDTDETIYTTELNKNTWGKVNIKYYVNWKVSIRNLRTNQSTEIFLDLKGKRVFICLESKSLGDTLAWVPYVEEFRKIHNCQVVCSTFWNDLFEKEYPDITFVKPGETVHDLIALYRLGLFYNENGIDYDKHPTNPIQHSLQWAAADILGIPFKEIKPRMKQPELDNKESKQVCIAVHSTAQAKYWNNPFGWQEVVNWLKQRGYTVKLMSNEHDGYMGNRNPKGVVQFPPSHINDVIAELKKSKAFIGISSGLSWVSWALGTPTVLISGFTESFNEMEDCIRIAAPKGKCSGCWNRHKFDPGDWNWCPDHKGTLRQFECSREITSGMVIQELEKIL